MNQYRKLIEAIIDKSDFALGSELSSALQNKFGVKPDNARKIVERAAEDQIIKASPISFGKKQLAYINVNDRFTKNLVLKIAKQTRPSLYRLITLLDQHDGCLPMHEAMKTCATPINVENAKSDSIRKLLGEIEVLEIGVLFKNSNDAQFIIYPSLSGQAETLSKTALKNMSVDVTFIPDILKALVRYNIIDNVKVLYRNKNTPEKSVTHNNYVWDAVGYTRTTGINSTRSSEATSVEKQTMVAIDVVVSREYTQEDLDGFLARIQGMQSAVKTGKRKVLPVVVYAGTETKILVHRIKKLGFLCFDVGSIYGSRVYDIIRNVIQVKRSDNKGDVPVEEVVDETLRIMRKAGQEDNLSNIKGDLFESLMYPLLRIVFSEALIEPGEKLRQKSDDGKKEEYEYDYIITNSRLKERTVVELKGYASTNYISLGNQDTKNSIQWFFSRTFPFAKKLLHLKDSHSVTALYITTSKFHEDGLTFLENLNKGKLKPANLDLWYDGEKLMRLLKSNGLIKTKGIIKKYYVKKSSEDQDITLTF
jgi:hypothetical protein